MHSSTRSVPGRRARTTRDKGDAARRHEEARPGDDAPDLDPLDPSAARHRPVEDSDPLALDPLDPLVPSAARHTQVEDSDPLALDPLGPMRRRGDISRRRWRRAS
jgi:hypothetical protein